MSFLTPEEVERGVAILLGRAIPEEPTTTFADVWQRRDDMRRDPGYANANVVPVDADMAQAMQAWVESMRWLGEDVA